MASPPRPSPSALDAFHYAGLDVGSLSCDAAIINERGEAISEEFTVPLAAEVVAEHEPQPLVTNLSASRLLEEVGRRHNCPARTTHAS